jgi:hypothetical protein
MKRRRLKREQGRARMAKLADAADLKSADLYRSWGFKSPSGHHKNPIKQAPGWPGVPDGKHSATDVADVEPRLNTSIKSI